jgi:homoserine dehydrogenase
VAGSLSGSLAWIFSHHDGTRSFAELVAQAQALGYTEPDPRQDLSGEDVRRKLLIIARTAGRALESDDVAVQSLTNFTDADFELREGKVLRYVARLDERGARAGLESLSPDDALAQGSGCDNRVAIWTDRYRERPIVIQGPGAGADVTAGALLEDVLRILR